MDDQSNNEAFDAAGVYGDPAEGTRPRESERNQRPASTPVPPRVGETLEFHPLANIFPLLTGEEFAGMVADIEQKGLIENIILTPDRLILEGRNRYRACLEAGVDPKFETTREPQESWLSFIISKNVHRRHLTASQRAAVAAELVTTALGDNQHCGGSAKLPRLDQSQAAELFNISTRSVGDAVKVKNHSAQLHDLVKAGKVTVDVAAKMARQQPENIDSFVEETKAGKAQAKPRLQIEAKEPLLVRDPAPENDAAAEKKPLTPDQLRAIWSTFDRLLAMVKGSTYQNERKNARRSLCGIMIEHDFTHKDIPRWVVRTHFGTPAQCTKCTQNFFNLSAED
jgi:ParB-like chromosome segregation protein Spo0J